MGLVRCESEGSLEEHIPSYPCEPRARVIAHYRPSMAALAEPMVEVYDGRPSPHGKMEICLEELLGHFVKTSLLQIKQSNGNGREENVKGTSNGFQLTREYDGFEADTGVLANQEVQNSSKLNQERDGSPRAHDGTLHKGNTNRGPSKGDGMELDRSGESFALP